MKVALAQMVSGHEVAGNLQHIKKTLVDAAESGAELIVFPENCLLMHSASLKAFATDLEQSKAVFDEISSLAAQHSIGVVLGSVPLLNDDGELVKAVALCWDKDGQLIGQYQKIHLFDAAVGDAHGNYKESDFFAPGHEVVLIQFGDFKIGLSICYDLRFPELFQRLRAQGADLFLVPAAFTHMTGEAHWEPLLRARAIENQVYVLGVNQGGHHSPTRETYGHTMAIDPWGQIIASLTKGEGLLIVDLLKDKIQEVRTRMPVFEHRRLHHS